MAGVLDGRALSQMAHREHRICFAALVGAEDRLTAGNGSGVVLFGTALSDQQIVILPDVIEVRRLGRGHACHGTAPECMGLARHAKVFNVVFRGPDTLAQTALAVRPVVGRPHDIALSVLIKENGGVDAGHVGEPVGFRPGTGGILRCDDEIATVAEIAVDEIERAPVIADRRGHDPAVAAVFLHMKAVIRCHNITQLLPMLQIPAVEQRDAGAKFEAGADQIVVLTHPTDGRIRIEAGNDGIGKPVFHAVFPLVLICWESAQALR